MIDGLLWNVDKKKQGRFGVYILIGRQTVHSLKMISPPGSSMNFQVVSKRNQQYQVLATSLYFDRLKAYNQTEGGHRPSIITFV